MIWLEQAATVLGRGDEADFTLEEDGVSRQHAKIILVGDGIVNLKDLGSTNGTFVNNAPIDATVLREGDRVQLGPDVTLRFGYRARGSDEMVALKCFVVTAREFEIALLVGEGHTNAEIGKRLHISRHTVVSHLSNVFQRTGVSTRTALATLVASGRLSGPR